MDAKLYSHEKKDWVIVPQDEVTEKVASGKYAFEQGVEVPVRFPDGGIGTVPAEKAVEAFRGGFSWQTDTDVKQYEQEQKAKIQEEHFGGNPLQAATLGAASGLTFGLSDVALSAAGLGEARQALREENPVSSTVGEIGGALTPFGLTAGIARGVGAVAGSAVKGSKLASQAANVGTRVGLGAERAAKVGTGLAKGAEITARGAAEGAAYGLQTGITEASLGDPSEIAENVLAHTATGALFGGVAGAGFEGLRRLGPVAKKAVQTPIEKAGDLSKAAARKIVEKAGTPLVKGADRKKTFKDLINLPDDELSRVTSSESQASLKVAQKEFKKAEKEIQGLIEKGNRAVQKRINSAPKQIKEELTQELQKHSGDVLKARNSLVNRADKLTEQSNQMLRQTPTQGAIINDLLKTTNDFSTTLSKSSKANVKSLEQRINRVVEDNLQDINNMSQVSAGKEILLLKDLREALPRPGSTLHKNLPNKVRDQVEGYRTRLDSLLNKHPEQELVALEKQAQRARSLVGTIDNLIGESAGATKLSGVYGNPVKAEQLNTLFNNMPEFNSHFRALAKVGEDATEKYRIARDIKKRMRELENAPFERGITTDDLVNIIDEFGLTKIRDKDVDRLRELAGALKGENLSVVDKTRQMLNTLGRPTDHLDNLTGIEGLVEKFAALGGEEVSKGGIRQALEKFQKYGPILRAVGLGAVASMSPTTAMVVGLAMGARNAQSTLSSLARFQQYSNIAVKTINGTLEKTAKILTSPKTEKLTRVALSKKERSREEKVKHMKDVSKMVAQMQNPEMAVQFIEERLPYIENAPTVNAMMGQKAIQIANFLYEKAPKDPLAGKTTFYDEAEWQPTDHELSKFDRYLTAAEQPMEVMERIQEGTVTSEEVETLKTVWPNLFNKLKEQVFNGIVDNGRKLDYRQRLILAQMFEIPADITLQPGFIFKMQATFQDQGGQPEKREEDRSQAKYRPKELRFDPQEFMTDSQRIMHKG